jgi:hypothetical protein
MDSLENFGFWELDAREVFPLSTKWRLANDWERPTKRAITAIIMHSDKTSLIEAQSGITSQKPNDHRGLWWLVRVKHVVSMHQVNSNKASKEKTTIICSHVTKTTHDSFKGTLSNLSHLRQVMLRKTTKHTIKITSSMTCKSLSHSLNKLPFVPL